MSLFGISILLGIASLVAISHGQCIRIRSSGNSSQQCGSQCSSCGTSVEDLTALLSIIRAIEDRETPKSGLYNAEEIILQLVNALVYATTNKGTGNTGTLPIGGTGTTGTPGTVGTGNMGGMGGTGGNGGTSGTGGTVPPPGTGTPVTPGNTGNMSPNTTNNNTGNSDDSLIDVDLLQQANDFEHLLRLGIAGKKILDLGIGPDDGAVGNLLTNLL